MYSNCVYKNVHGKCEHVESDLICATDVWSGNCLQAFESYKIICINFYDPNMEDVDFELDKRREI